MAQRGERSHNSAFLARLAAAKLRSLRLARGLTQTALGEKAGLRRSHISRVEQGSRSPSLETLERLTTALGVPLYILFYSWPSESAAESGAHPKDVAFFDELRKALAQLNPSQRDTVMKLARRLADRPTEH